MLMAEDHIGHLIFNIERSVQRVPVRRGDKAIAVGRERAVRRVAGEDCRTPQVAVFLGKGCRQIISAPVLMHLRRPVDPVVHIEVFRGKHRLRLAPMHQITAGVDIEPANFFAKIGSAGAVEIITAVLREDKGVADVDFIC